MKYLVISDIHSKADSLDQLPTDDDFGCICLGDICAGDPLGSARAIDWLMEYEAICVSGSHDKPVVDDVALENYRVREKTLREAGRGNPDLFIKFYNDALRVRNGLNEDQFNFLVSLPRLHTMKQGGKTIHLIHNSLKIKVNTTGNRILNTDVARNNFESPEFTGDILLVGHSHVPIAYREYHGEITETLFTETKTLKLQEGRHIMNPGSLQRIRTYARHNPKTMVFEGDRRISYGILDLAESTFEVRFI
ncbi:MAG: metallophosphoesterase family protein [Candidatus Thorarchaeota archaeon]